MTLRPQSNGKCPHPIAGCGVAMLLLMALGCLLPGLVVAQSTAGLGSSVAQVTEQPVAARGARVRWGGVIEQVDVSQSHYTLRVRGYPLDRWRRPRLDQPSAGWFLVIISGRDAIASHAPGRLITVTGRVSAEVESITAGRAQRLAVVRAERRELWPHSHTVWVPPTPATHATVIARSPPRGPDPIVALAGLALVGALIAADSVHIGIGFGHHHHLGVRRHRYRHHHRGYGRFSLSGKYRH